MAKSPRPVTQGRGIFDFLDAEFPAAELYWVVGGEEYLREVVVKRLRNQFLEPGFADFNHQRLRLSASVRLNQVGDALADLPMLAERRLLELEQAHELNARGADELERLLEMPRDAGLLVVVVSETPKGKASLWETLKSKALLLNCQVEAPQMGEFVGFCCRELKLDLSASQRQLVIERNAGGLRAIRSSLERLAGFAGAEGKLSDTQVEELVHDSSQVQAWKLTAAIGKRQCPEAYCILHRLLRQEPAQTLLSYINSYLLGLVQVAELKPRLKTAAAIAREIPRRSEFQIRKSLEELASWGEGDLAQAFERMARADYRIKTGADPLLVLQIFILQLCHRSGR